MKGWRRSRWFRTFLLCALFFGVLLDVLSGMYCYVGREYAASGDGSEDFYVSQEGFHQILDGYIRLFEEYMQIGSLIGEGGDVDYDKEILRSLTDGKTYTVKELLRNSAAEGVGTASFRKFMDEFSENCRRGISYPWKSRYMLACDSRVIVEGNRIFAFASSSKPLSSQKVADMKRHLAHMEITSTDDVTFEEDFRDDLIVSFSGKISWKHHFKARSAYEEYIITYFPAYAKCYFIKKALSSYREQGQEGFMALYRKYRNSGADKRLSEEEFYQELKGEYSRREKTVGSREIPWKTHLVPRSVEEARKYVTFLVETYQELKYLFSQSNFLYAYEDSSNMVLTNHPDQWQQIKAELEGGEKLEKATDRSPRAFYYYNSRDYEGVGNLPEDMLPMSGNITEKIRNIGKNYSQSSYQIAVGIDLRGVVNARREDEFVEKYREMVQKRELYRCGSISFLIGSILAGLSFLLLCLRSGSPVQEGAEAEPLYWYDRIWLEAQGILLYLMMGMTVWVWKMWNGFLIHPLIVLCAAAISLLLYGCLRILLSVIKRMKLHCGGQYSGIYLFFREVVWRKASLREFGRKISYRMAFIPIRRKFGFLALTEAMLFLYYGVSAGYVFLDRRVTVRTYLLSSLGVIGLVLGGIFAAVMLFWQKNTMNEQMVEYRVIAAMKKIIQGDFSGQLSEGEPMSLRMKELVRAVNQMGDVVEKAVEESVRSERMKTELIANVSHDIKTPLTSIINYVDLLQEEDISSETAGKYIAVLQKKSQNLKVLMEDLIEASKASSGVIELDIHPMDFCELIRQTNGEFEERFSQCSLELISELPTEPMMFEGDGRRMFRILENLYSNTAKYAMEHTRVYVALERVEDSLEFSMKNISATKLNITPEELTERFVRGDHARTTEGSGLGLSIAKSLTELMGGEFRIELDGDLFCAKIVFPEMTEA